MESLTEDLWTMVLARLPIKIVTGFKLVCKQWKSIVESPFFRNHFTSVHQNSRSSSWSLMSSSCYRPPEMMGHYQCDTWGLDRSLGSFIESFLADIKQKHKYGRVSVEAYSDAGFILIQVMSSRRVIYVANPVSRECVEIFNLDTRPLGFVTYQSSSKWGLVTRTENGVLLGYKVVLFERNNWEDTKKLNCLIYSSETRLWSLETLHLPNSFNYRYPGYSISLNGNLHWLALSTDRHNIVLSMDFYDTSTGSVRCRVTPFPDLEKTTKFTRFCTPCQGFLMYMNITKVDGSLEDKLCLWKLQSEGWQLISEISPDLTLAGLDCSPLMINPLDAKTAYFWSVKQERLLSINLHNGKFVNHNQFEAMVSLKSQIERVLIIGREYFIPFILPKWLHRIPNTVNIKEPTTTANTEHQKKRSFTVDETGKVIAVYEEEPAYSQQKPNVNQLSSHDI